MLEEIAYTLGDSLRTDHILVLIEEYGDMRVEESQDESED